MKYEDILNSLRQAFRHYRRTRQDVPNYQPPKSLYEIQNNRIELTKLDLMLDLVYGIASKKATEKQYEIGFRVGVNKTLRRVHGDSKSLDPDEKTRIGVRVNKLLEVALVAAENAARGKFYDPNPSDMHMTAIDFLYLKNLPVLPDDVDDLFAA